MVAHAPVKLPSIQLFFQEGTSDKVYEAAILEDRGAYTVRVRWGRRGTRLSEGAKAVRVPLADATKVYERLVREKQGKGYAESAAASGAKASARAVVGHSAQLLSSLDDADLDAFLRDDAMVAQQKLDGKRVLLHVDDGVVATNRSGQKTSVDRALLAGLAYLPRATIVDGEVLDGGLWLFDVLQVAGEDVRERGYLERWELLDGELEPALTGGAGVLPIAKGKRAKRALHDRLRGARAEGLVFKHRDAPYRSGRGATQRKYKFIKSADVMIVENAGNAYRMEVWDGRARFEVGRVFAGTTNASRADLDRRLGRGEEPVAEVRYLYATDDHQLFQPVFVGLRDDKPADACTRAQLVETDRSVIT